MDDQAARELRLVAEDLAASTGRLRRLLENHDADAARLADEIMEAARDLGSMSVKLANLSSSIRSAG